jgi:hypothetical protein
VVAAVSVVVVVVVVEVRKPLQQYKMRTMYFAVQLMEVCGINIHNYLQVKWVANRNR